MLNLRADALSFTLPESWDEVTLGQFMKLVNATTVRDRLIIASGKSEADLRPLRAPDLAQITVDHLAFMNTLPGISADDAPKTLRVGDALIDVPQNLGTELTISQMWDVADEIKGLGEYEEGQESELLFAVTRPILSVFLAPAILQKTYGSFKDAEAVYGRIDSLPCTDALRVSAFFLAAYLSPMRSGRITLSKASPHPATGLTRWRLSLRRALTRLIPRLRPTC